MLRNARSVIVVFLVCSLFTSTISLAQQQKPLNNVVRQTLLAMLRTEHDEVQKHYFDPKLKGLDWDGRYRQYSKAIEDVPDMGTGLNIVSAFLSGLKDSHTFLLPPTRVNRINLGYVLTLIGNTCYVTKIRPNTDAEKKLHIGDQVLTLNGFRVDRKDYSDLFYAINVLEPQRSVTLNLMSPDGSIRAATVNSIVKPNKIMLDVTQGIDIHDLEIRAEADEHITRQRYIENGDSLILKIPEFNFGFDEMDRIMAAAHKHKTLILDLRGNQGGSIDSLQLLIGSLFDHEIKIYDRVSRKASKPDIVKPRGKVFGGKLIVLVDSESASASEIFARVVQLEHRGTVLGDKTAGAVMESLQYLESSGMDTRVFYGISVTESNLIMSDGNSLEGVGVTPDEIVLPSADDLAKSRDPVLAHAAELAGVKLDATEAGKLFPLEWMPM
jgi:carboxyl-terminal processing protease